MSFSKLMLIYLLGIIIDTLANLREEDEKKNNDIETICFICG